MPRAQHKSLIQWVHFTFSMSFLSLNPQVCFSLHPLFKCTSHFRPHCFRHIFWCLFPRVFWFKCLLGSSLTSQKPLNVMEIASRMNSSHQRACCIEMEDGSSPTIPGDLQCEACGPSRRLPGDMHWKNIHQTLTCPMDPLFNWHAVNEPQCHTPCWPRGCCTPSWPYMVRFLVVSLFFVTPLVCTSVLLPSCFPFGLCAPFSHPTPLSDWLLPLAAPPSAYRPGPSSS